MSAKLLFIFFSSMLMLSCKSSLPENEQEMRAKELWKTDYKNVVFQRCVFLGLYRSKQIRSVLKMDRSTHQDFAYGLVQYKYIDSIVQPIIYNAKLDSAKHYEKYLKGFNEIERDELNGLPIFRYCLDFFSSDTLEIIATKKVNEMEYLWKR